LQLLGRDPLPCIAHQLRKLLGVHRLQPNAQPAPCAPGCEIEHVGADLHQNLRLAERHVHDREARLARALRVLRHDAPVHPKAGAHKVRRFRHFGQRQGRGAQVVHCRHQAAIRSFT
jgi:hypothetical protein